MDILDSVVPQMLDGVDALALSTLVMEVCIMPCDSYKIK